jgi:hypothetical protein
MMSEDEIRGFVDEATSITGDRVTVTERILARWLKDRESAAEDAAEDARNAIYDDFQDGWHTLGGGE